MYRKENSTNIFMDLNQYLLNVFVFIYKSRMTYFKLLPWYIKNQVLLHSL